MADVIVQVEAVIFNPMGHRDKAGAAELEVKRRPRRQFPQLGQQVAGEMTAMAWGRLEDLQGGHVDRRFLGFKTQECQIQSVQSSCHSCSIQLPPVGLQYCKKTAAVTIQLGFPNAVNLQHGFRVLGPRAGHLPQG